MTHYEARLERDLERIRGELSAIATQVQAALRGAVHALLSGSRSQAYDCIQGDLPINRAVRKLDRTCHGFIAVHLPSAGPLRWVSAVMRINSALERIGDYAVTICREAVQLPKSPDGTLAREIELMSKESSQMLGQAMQAFVDRNAEAAKATMIMAEQVERAFDAMLEELTGGNGGWTKREIYALLVIFHELERVSDQAKNICEETVFAVTGEGKARKTYRVLFLDQDNAGASILAEALGRKGYPDHMAFASAGRATAASFDPNMSKLAAERGLDLGRKTPLTLEPIEGELSELHVIVSLAGAVTDYMERVPFHTVALEWNVGAAPDPNAADAAERWEEIYRNLAVRLRDLVHVMHGDEVT
jgi:phosphate transport system protein